MPETLLHIGYPKTATTWFVNYFYPNVKNINAVFSNSFEYSTTNDNEYFKVNPEKLKTDKEQIIIISHKFSGFEEFKWNNGYYRNFFITQLKSNFPEASIIVFIRNQIDFLASACSSYITHGGTFTFPQLFRNGALSDGKMFSFEFLDYYKLICQYKEQFGENKVHVFLYEDFLNDNKTFLKDYSSKFNFDIDLENISFRKHNEKLRKGLSSFIRFTNRFSRNGVQPKSFIIHAPWMFKWVNKQFALRMNKNKIFGNKSEVNEILGNELIVYMNEYYKKSNNLLISQYGFDSIKKYGYPL